MKQKIQSMLEQIAQQHSIEILYACESGSRAWGFPSTDSDYDVRFIYKRKLPEYLSVCTVEDQLVFPIDQQLDVYGWDLKKVLQLLSKSNATPFEWLQSPMVYKEHPCFKKELMPLLSEYFSARTQVFHYLGIARSALDTMHNNQIKSKKLFYVLRPLLAAQWIVDKGEYPPMNIQPLLQIAPIEIQSILQQMIVEKSYETESMYLTPNAYLLNFIFQTMENLSVKASEFTAVRFEIDKLNTSFQKMIQ
jgi:predicted nucleotidyltransferase